MPAELLAILVLLASSCMRGGSGTVASYRPLGSISLSDPSFVSVLNTSDGAPPSLWITVFSAFGSGKVYSVANVSSVYPDFSKASPVLQSSKFKWPNELSVAPKEIGDYVVVPDGFLVPGKSTGEIYLLSTSCQDKCSPIQLTSQKSSWFYGMVQWRDMNGDGRLDILTARATKPIFGKSGGELLWLEQPPSDPLTSVPWEEHSLASGPDVDFLAVDLDPNDDHFEVFATEFFAQRFTLLTISTKNSTVTNTRVIDDSIGSAYSVSMVDLNNDNRKELLVTNHLGNDGGSVFAYEVPDDPLTGEFKRHVLASNFTVTSSGFNQAAPGFAYAFRPSLQYVGKPLILVAGDGSQKAYLLQPTSSGRSSPSLPASSEPSVDFSYNCSVVLDAGGIVGSIGVDNLIGSEGWAEFFVPNYSKGELYSYTFSP